MREKVIANKKAHEDKVIHNTFNVHHKWWILYDNIMLQIFT
jgi:hypothetical protein